MPRARGSQHCVGPRSQGRDWGRGQGQGEELREEVGAGAGEELREEAGAGAGGGAKEGGGSRDGGGAKGGGGSRGRVRGAGRSRGVDYGEGARAGASLGIPRAQHQPGALRLLGSGPAVSRRPAPGPPGAHCVRPRSWALTAVLTEAWASPPSRRPCP